LGVSSSTVSTAAGRSLTVRRFRLATHTWYLLPFLVVTTAIVIIPIAYSLYLSLFHYNLSKPYMGQSYTGLDNYIAIFRDPAVLKSLKISLEYVFASLVGELLFGLALALLVSRGLPGLSVFRFLLIVPMMLTPSTVGLVWKFFYGFTGLVNYLLRIIGIGALDWYSSKWALLSVIIVSVWQNYPFSFLVLFAGMQTIPPTLIEAAQIDGASAWRVFSRITIPLMRSFIIVILVMRSTNLLRYVDLIFTLTFGGPGSATQTLSFLIYTNGFSFFEMGYGSALSFMLIGISVVITWGYMRWMKNEQDE
jgi:multiple sugar transport system permease protein